MKIRLQCWLPLKNSSKQNERIATMNAWTSHLLITDTATARAQAWGWDWLASFTYTPGFFRSLGRNWKVPDMIGLCCETLTFSPQVSKPRCVMGLPQAPFCTLAAVSLEIAVQYLGARTRHQEKTHQVPLVIVRSGFLRLEMQPIDLKCIPLRSMEAA